MQNYKKALSKGFSVKRGLFRRRRIPRIIKIHRVDQAGLGSDFLPLMKGSPNERMLSGIRLLELLLPEAREKELELQGVKCTKISTPNKSKPTLSFVFTRGNETHRVLCEVGKCLLWTIDGTGGREELRSLEQVRQKIEEALQRLF